jgi:hypothetical protein
MAQSRRHSIVWLAAFALLVAACGSTSSTPVPPATGQPATGQPATAAPAATSPATPSAPGATGATVKVPPAPTSFTATRHSGSVPCPSAAADSCSQTDLAWQSTADASTWFRVYEAGTGEGPDTCTDVQGETQLVLETKPGVRSAQLFAEMAVGGGEACYWITAVNSAGESTQVPAPSATQAADQEPPAPTSFTATRHSGSVPCPSAAADSCSQTDLAWQSTADASTWFRVYEAGTGEGPDTCTDVQGETQLVLETKPGVRSAQLFAEMAVGGGEACYWITAVNSAGESTLAPAAGQ